MVDIPKRTKGRFVCIINSIIITNKVNLISKGEDLHSRSDKSEEAQDQI